MDAAPFETFEHDADIGVRGRGATLAEATGLRVGRAPGGGWVAECVVDV